MGVDWQPVILAIAALIVAITPAVAGLIVSVGTNRKVGRIETNTNGQLSALQQEIKLLHAQLANRRANDRGPS